MFIPYDVESAGYLRALGVERIAAYAVELMRKYGDIERVRRALNHDNAEVTMIYALADRLPARKRRRKK